MGATLSEHDPGGVVPIGQGKNIIISTNIPLPVKRSLEPSISFQILQVVEATHNDFKDARVVTLYLMAPFTINTSPLTILQEALGA